MGIAQYSTAKYKALSGDMLSRPFCAWHRCWFMIVVFQLVDVIISGGDHTRTLRRVEEIN